MNNIKSQPAFTSTVVPRQAMKNFGKFTDDLEKSFELKGLGGSIDSIRTRISLGQAGVGSKDGNFVFVGKDKAADNFIYRRLRDIDDSVKYIDDAPELKSDPNAIAFEIIG